ncbi:MAG: biotin--[acetyl-CoA-carboxylase] ligase [Thermoplasmata archaeon HGW-Thermoplasmata-1]|nr:MAG: biotin--[acetyl-CoA-carboxylase] ligase [Thermoplasmata archaeon HGW-Thermoplasmata-1]
MTLTQPDRITRYENYEILHYASLESTNTEGKRLARNGAGERTVVVADIQSGGRGRIGRRWESPLGGAWFSIILRPRVPANEVPSLALVAGIAVAKALRSLGMNRAMIKWPNDVNIDGKKICGILAESASDCSEGGRDGVGFAVIGIGINVKNPVASLPETIRERSASVAGEGSDESVENVIGEVLSAFDGLYEIFTASGFRVLRNEWLKLSETAGMRVSVEVGAEEKVSGTAIGIGEKGELLIKKDDGEIATILAGDCVHATSDA